MVREIPLTQGYVALVDDEDFEWLSHWNWCLRHDSKQTQYYAQRAHRDKLGRKRILTMHRAIMTPPDGLLVDHIDRNGLNNTRSNLRLATPSENSINTSFRSNNKSGFRGVSWDKERGKWVTRIKAGGRQIQVGRFDDKEEAARAYDEAARRYHGEFAVTNFGRD